MIVSSGKQLTVTGAAQFLFCSLSGVLGFYPSGIDLEVSPPEQPFNDCFCQSLVERRKEHGLPLTINDTQSLLKILP